MPQHRWGEICKGLGKQLHAKGLAASPDSVSIGPEETKGINPVGSFLWGANSRGRASRLRQELGWKPTGRPVEATLSDAVDVEKARLGK